MQKKKLIVTICVSAVFILSIGGYCTVEAIKSSNSKQKQTSSAMSSKTNSSVVDSSTISSSHPNDTISSQVESPSDNHVNSTEVVTSTIGAGGTEQPSPERASDPIVANVTSSQIESITAGMTYQEIINILGETRGYGRYSKEYIVDNEKVLTLSYNDINDVCESSGSELLSQAITFKENREKTITMTSQDGDIGMEPSVVSAKVIEDYFVMCVIGGLNDKYTFNTNNAQIMFDDGKPATLNDIQPQDNLLLSYNIILTTYPGQIQCLKVVIQK